MRQARGLTDNTVAIESYAESVPVRTPGARGYLERARAFEQDLHRFDEVGLRRSYHGFYFISHYYPLRAMDEINAGTARRTVEELAGSPFETYLHYPFCEQICTFCHFHKKVGCPSTIAGREDAAVDTLIREMEINRGILGEPISARSLQLGGGTPSLMGNDNLRRLLDACDVNMDIQPGAEIKTEIYPKAYDEGHLREKLRIMRDFGFTELVIDLESGNRRTLDTINRRNSSLEDYLRLVDICMSEGFDRFITALMAGLPFETYDSLHRTVETIAAIDEVRVLNVFPTIMRDTDPITRQLEKAPEGFNDAATRDRMWLMARDMLSDRGFVDGPISYLHRPEDRPEQQADKFECVNLMGFGPSAFGYMNGPGDDWGGQYFNYCDEISHARRIAEGQPAIWRLGRYDKTERARRKVIFGLANVKAENLVDIERHFDVDIDALYGRTFNALLALGLIELRPEEQGIAYTAEGLARLEEITYFLYSDFAKDRSDRLPDPGVPHYKALIDQHYTVTMDPRDRAAFEAFAAGHPPEFMYRLRPLPGASRAVFATGARSA